MGRREMVRPLVAAAIASIVMISIDGWRAEVCYHSKFFKLH